MDALINAVKGLAGQNAGKLGQARLATVTSVDTSTYTARVTVQPEASLSGWLPILTPWAGGGWGLGCLPAPGDQVVVLAQEGDTEQGIILGRLWSAKTAPIQPPIGECWLVHASGSYIKLHNDGSLESAAPSWTHHGNLAVMGNVFDSVGSIADLRAHYNEHTHPPTNAAAAPQD